MSTVPENRLIITSEIPDIEEGWYQRFFEIIDEISKKTLEEQDEKYHVARYVIANYLYFIYERLQKNVSREIDYDQVKSWAKKNQKLATYLLCTIVGFPNEAFDFWINPRVDLLKGSMYSPSNRFNKNIYH